MYTTAEGANLHGPPGPVALIDQRPILLYALVLLAKSSDRDQARQGLAELAEDRAAVDGVQPFQLPVRGNVVLLHSEVEEDQRGCC